MLSFSDIKLGKVVTFNGQPCVIVSCEFLRMQMRKPVKKCKMRNLVTGTNIDYNFKSGEEVEEADLRREEASFMYKEGKNLSFMLSNTFETIELPVEIMGGKDDYLKENLEVFIIYFNDNPISVDLPIKIAYKVKHTTDAAKGNSVSDIMKDAELENGKVVKVPGFIKNGESVVINTVEDEYVGRE